MTVGRMTWTSLTLLPSLTSLNYPENRYLSGEVIANEFGSCVNVIDRHWTKVTFYVEEYCLRKRYCQSGYGMKVKQTMNGLFFIFSVMKDFCLVGIPLFPLEVFDHWFSCSYCVSWHKQWRPTGVGITTSGQYVTINKTF